MAIIVKQDKVFEPVPVGMHQAVCSHVCDIGTHESTFDGRSITRKQLVIIWEINEVMNEGKNAGSPFTISKFYTQSLDSKATLRKDLNSWRGRDMSEEELKGFDVEKLKGVNCMLNIVNDPKADGSVRQKIAAITPPLKGAAKLVPVLVSEPEWVAKKRADSLEAKQSSATNPDADDCPPHTDNDLPF
jgi:hypothetical protein